MPSIGSIIELSNVTHALSAQLLTTSTDIVYGHTVTSIQWPPYTADSCASEEDVTFDMCRPVELTLNHSDDGSRKITAQLVVGADGAESFVRRSAGIQVQRWSYDQRGLVATLNISPSSGDDENQTAWQRFLPTGPLALLPLSNEWSSLVWSAPPETAVKLQKMAPKDFCALLNAAFVLTPVDVQYLVDAVDEQGHTGEGFLEQEISWRMEVLLKEQSLDFRMMPPQIMDVVDKSRASFPLRLRQAESYIRPRLALLGDAAHVMHPLAGQGLNMGMGDVKALTDILKEAVRSGQDFGDLSVLRKYNQDRMLKNAGMQMTVDGIGKLFKSDLYPLQQLRSLGLDMLNDVPLIKVSHGQ